MVRRWLSKSIFTGSFPSVFFLFFFQFTHQWRCFSRAARSTVSWTTPCISWTTPCVSWLTLFSLSYFFSSSLKNPFDCGSSLASLLVFCVVSVFVFWAAFKDCADFKSVRNANCGFWWVPCIWFSDGLWLCAIDRILCRVLSSILWFFIKAVSSLMNCSYAPPERFRLFFDTIDFLR